MTLVEAVQAAVERLSRPGIEGWGLQVAPQLQELGEIVVVSPSEGCTSETCCHVSHHPAAPVVRWVPKDGVRAVHLGEESAVDDMTIDYYAILYQDGVIYAKHVEPAHFWARLLVVEEGDVPEWALASLSLANG